MSFGCGSSRGVGREASSVATKGQVAEASLPVSNTEKLPTTAQEGSYERIQTNNIRSITLPIAPQQMRYMLFSSMDTHPKIPCALSRENKQDGYEVLGSLFISMFFMLARVQQREPPEAPSCQCGIYSGHALQIVHPTPGLQDNQWPVLYKKNGQHQKGQSITNRNETRSSTGR